MKWLGRQTGISTSTYSNLVAQSNPPKPKSKIRHTGLGRTRTTKHEYSSHLEEDYKVDEKKLIPQRLIS